MNHFRKTLVLLFSLLPLMSHAQTAPLQDWCDRLTQRLVRNTNRDTMTRNEQLEMESARRNWDDCAATLERLRAQQNALGPHICPDNPNCREINELGAQIAKLVYTCNDLMHEFMNSQFTYGSHEEWLREGGLQGLANQLRTPGRHGFRCEQVLEANCGSVRVPPIEDPRDRNQQVAHRTADALNFTIRGFEPPPEGSEPGNDPNPDNAGNHLSDTDREACQFQSRIYQRRRAARRAVENSCAGTPANSETDVRVQMALESPDCTGEVFTMGNPQHYHVIRSQGANGEINRAIRVTAGVSGMGNPMSLAEENTVNAFTRLANMCVSEYIRPIWARYGIDFQLSFERNASDRQDRIDRQLVLSNHPECIRSSSSTYCLHPSCDPANETCFNQLSAAISSPGSINFCVLILHESGHWLGLPDEYEMRPHPNLTCLRTGRALDNPIVRGRTFDREFDTELQDWSANPTAQHVTSIMQLEGTIGILSGLFDRTTGGHLNSDPLNHYEFFADQLQEILSRACDPTEATSIQYRLWNGNGTVRNYSP